MIDRRMLIGLLPAAMWAAQGRAFSQPAATRPIKRIRTNTLEIAYEESGPEAGIPVLLMHGFPYDPRAYDEVVPPLVAAGYRAIVPYLRGYGPTRFLSAQTPRSGQQAALGKDLLDFMDALQVPSATLVVFDWGCGVQLSNFARVSAPRAPGAGPPPVVPVLLPHGARSSRPDPESRRPL